MSENLAYPALFNKSNNLTKLAHGSFMLEPNPDILHDMSKEMGMSENEVLAMISHDMERTIKSMSAHVVPGTSQIILNCTFNKQFTERLKREVTSQESKEAGASSAR